MGWGVQIFKWGYFSKKLNLNYYIQIELYKLFNIQQLNKNIINVQDAKNDFLYVCKRYFLCNKINKNKKD